MNVMFKTCGAIDSHEDLTRHQGDRGMDRCQFLRHVGSLLVWFLDSQLSKWGWVKTYAILGEMNMQNFQLFLL